MTLPPHIISLLHDARDARITWTQHPTPANQRAASDLHVRATAAVHGFCQEFIVHGAVAA